MFEVNTDGHIKNYSEEEFLRKFGMESKRELFKTPFTKHVLHIDGKTVIVTLKEN